MAKRDNGMLPSLGNIFSSIGGGNRQGIFQQGHDKKGRPFEKKLDDNGIYTKQEILKDGTPKLTIKDLRNKKK